MTEETKLADDASWDHYAEEFVNPLRQQLALALSQWRDDLRRPPAADSLERRLAHIDQQLSALRRPADDVARVVGLLDALASDCDAGEENDWENHEWIDAASLLRQASALLTSLASGRDDGWLPVGTAEPDGQAWLVWSPERIEPSIAYRATSGGRPQWFADRGGPTLTWLPTLIRPLPAPPTNGGKS